MIEFLFLAINMKIENVCNSRPRYSNNKLSDNIKTTEPIKTNINRQLTSKVLSSISSNIIKKDINTKIKNTPFHMLASNKFEFHKP